MFRFFFYLCCKIHLRSLMITVLISSLQKFMNQRVRPEGISDTGINFTKKNPSQRVQNWNEEVKKIFNDQKYVMDLNPSYGHGIWKRNKNTRTCSFQYFFKVQYWHSFKCVQSLEKLGQLWKSNLWFISETAQMSLKPWRQSIIFWEGTISQGQ